MNARTLIQFPSGQVITIANGDRQDFPSLGEALAYMDSHGETVQQIGSMDQPNANDYIVSVMNQFDHLLYTTGRQAAADYLTNEWNNAHPEVPLPRTVYDSISAGPVGNFDIDTGAVVTSPLDLAGMNPLLVGGLVIGVLYLMFKGKSKGSSSSELI
jgi:hypothetical protein